MATYKDAVLLGLIDLCLVNASRAGAAPDMVTTRQLAEKVIESTGRGAGPSTTTISRSPRSSR